MDKLAFYLFIYFLNDNECDTKPWFYFMVHIQKFFIFCQAWIISNKVDLPHLSFNITLFFKLASKMPIPKDNSICQFLFGALVLQLSAIADRFFLL